MEKDRQLDRRLVRVPLEKRVLNDQIAEAAAILHVFGVENFATALECSGDDQRVIPRELMGTLQP
jgi:hypothetical protein